MADESWSETDAGTLSSTETLSRSTTDAAYVATDTASTEKSPSSDVETATASETISVTKYTGAGATLSMTYQYAPRFGELRIHGGTVPTLSGVSDAETSERLDHFGHENDGGY